MDCFTVINSNLDLQVDMDHPDWLWWTPSIWFIGLNWSKKLILKFVPRQYHHETLKPKQCPWPSSQGLRRLCWVLETSFLDSCALIQQLKHWKQMSSHYLCIYHRMHKLTCNFKNNKVNFCPALSLASSYFKFIQPQLALHQKHTVPLTHNTGKAW